MSTTSIIFINDAKFPVNVSTWHSITSGFSKLNIIIVHPNDSVMILSETGEWYVDTLLYDKTHCQQVLDAGFSVGEEIGKFRNCPCIEGNYSWLNDERFQLLFNDGTITFCEK
jgi:hypothetical protein